MSERTVRRSLNKHNYSYCTKQRRGIVTTEDCRKRKKIASTVKNTTRSDFWTNCVYFDQVNFPHKYNLLEEVRPCKNKAWRLSSERLSHQAKEKEKKLVAGFLVGISYKKGLVMSTQYFGKLIGKRFAKIVKKDFPKAFRDIIVPQNKLFLQDGDPIQNSKRANRAFDAIGCKVFAMPGRSLDVNPIEITCNRIGEKLTEDVITHQIKREDFEEFSARVKRNFAESPVKEMDKTIDSMQKRMKLITKSCNKRIKY